MVATAVCRRFFRRPRIDELVARGRPPVGARRSRSPSTYRQVGRAGDRRRPRESRALHRVRGSPGSPERCATPTSRSHAGIGGPGPVLRRPGKPKDAAAVLDDHGRISIPSSSEQTADRLGRSRRGLESGRAVLDALVVNPGNVAGVREFGRPGFQAGRHFLRIL